MNKLIILIILVVYSLSGFPQKALIKFRKNPTGLVTDVITMSENKFILKDGEFSYASIKAVTFQDQKFYNAYRNGLKTKNIISILNPRIATLSYGSIELIDFENSLANQDTTKQWRITTGDANEYFGEIISKDSKEIKLKTEKLGIITIQMIDVRTINEIESDQIIGGELWMENPQAARYFWAPNGYGLKKGEGYYQNVWIMFNQISVGVSDNTSIGFGFMPLFLLGETSVPLWITPKFSIPIKKDKFNVGGGALIGTIAGFDAGFFGITYGVATFGDQDKNLNLGLGYGFAGGNWGNTPVITLGAMVRLNKRGYFITENYYMNKNYGLISLGGRIVWTRISIDFGLVTPVGDTGGFVSAPWLGIVFPFGQ